MFDTEPLGSQADPPNRAEGDGRDGARAGSPEVRPWEFDEEAGRRPPLRSRVGDLVTSPSRGFAYVSGRGGKLRRDRYRDADVPTPLRSPRTAFEVMTDEFIISTFRLIRHLPGLADWERYAAELEKAVPLAREQGFLDDPESFHREPAPASLRMRKGRGRARGMEVASFASGWEPPAGWPGVHRWNGYADNRQGRAWVLRHPGAPRPWVIVLHGTSMGRTSDVRVLRARRVHEELGVNVLVPVLPLHGSRSNPDAELPCVDPLDQVFGFAQAVSDVRRLTGWIRKEQGADTPIGLFGVSLGGFLSAMVASLDEGIAAVAPIVPPSDFPELFLRASPESYTRSPQIEMLSASIAEIHQLVSPLTLQPKVAFEGRLIIAGNADRLVDPVEQVAPLWKHWGEPRIHWYHGGHVGGMRRDSVWKVMLEHFAEQGVVADGNRSD